MIRLINRQIVIIRNWKSCFLKRQLINRNVLSCSLEAIDKNKQVMLFLRGHVLELVPVISLNEIQIHMYLECSIRNGWKERV